MVTCAACGSESPDEFAFCPHCAAALSVTPAVADERKVVTVLFCDLVGFTAMSEAADPEDVDALLRAYYATARKVIESHGGTVEKFIGDAVVGAFGVPAVHEDDPERAVRAGLRLIRALGNLERPDGKPLEARVGVNTGEALVRLDLSRSSGGGFLIGDVVNTAARLQSAAPANGVVVAGATHALTSAVIDYKLLAPVAHKGKSARVASWLAEGPVSRQGTRTGVAAPLPQVGRDGERDYLVSLFEKATGTSSPQVVLVLGDPGIGKTRLVQELFAHVDGLPAMTTWREGHCVPYGESRTFRALRGIVMAHAGILEGDDAPAVEERLRQAVPEGPEHQWLVDRLRPLVGLEALQADREEHFAAWMKFFEALARRRPLVLIVEDMHWASDAMLAFVEYFSLHVGAVPLLLVCTARPQLFERSAPFAASEGRVTRIWLERLTDEDTSRLVRSLPETAGVGEALIELVVRRAEGNPFFAEELARLLVYATPFDPGGAPGGGLALPRSIQAVIAARVDALSAAAKTALADAAVMGQTFWTGALIALASGESPAVDEALIELLERQLVRRVHDASVRDEDEYVFCHGMVRDVIYHQLPRAARALKHEAFARWIEAKTGERAGDVADVLARHYGTAAELARATGDDRLFAASAPPALRYLSIAGDGVLRLDAAAAARQYARALDLAGPRHVQRPSLLARWAEALFQDGRYRESAAALEEAAASLRAAGDNRAAALALARLADVLYALGDPGVNALLEEAMALLQGEEPSPDMVTVLGRWGKALWLSGAPRAGLEKIEQAVALARRLDEPEPVVLLGYRGGIRCILGDVGGLDDYVAALSAANALAQVREAAVLTFNYADALLSYNGPRAAADVLREGLTSARRRHIEELAAAEATPGVVSPGQTGEWDAETVRRLTVNLIESLGMIGEWDEALAKTAAVTPGLERSEARSDLVIVRTQEAVVRAWRGEAELAAPFLAWLEHRGLESEIPWIAAYALLSTAPVRLRLGEVHLALDLLRRWEARPRPGSGPNYVAYLPEALRTALAGGDEALAARLATGIDPLLPMQRNVLATTQGLLGEREGRYAEAAASFADAAMRWRAFSMPYEEAQALLGQGRCLTALGRAARAGTPLAAARKIFARLGAAPALEEADAAISSLAGRR